MLSTRNITCTSYVLFCFVSVERVTYRKLKRKAIILEYLQKVKVVEGTNPIQKVALFNWFVVCLVWYFPCMSSTFTLTKLGAGYTAISINIVGSKHKARRKDRKVMWDGFFSE